MPASHQRHARLRRKDPEERQVAHRPQLAGEADGGIVARADALQHEGFAPRRFGQQAAVADDADAAGGAARAAAADARMRHVVQQARFQDRQILRHADGLAFAIGEADQPRTALAQSPHAARGQHQHEQAGIADQEALRDPVKRNAMLPRADMFDRERFRAPLLRLVKLPSGFCALKDAERRRSRQQHRKREQHRRDAPEPRPQPKPEIEADAAVCPCHDQHQELER